MSPDPQSSALTTRLFRQHLVREVLYMLQYLLDEKQELQRYGPENENGSDIGSGHRK